MSAAAYETIRFELESAIATLVLNRPRVHNAINSRCLQETIRALQECARSSDIRVIVIRGEGSRSFTSGADISEIAGYGPREMELYNREWLRLFDTIEALPKPVIASVEGWATGGGTELSLACDFVICADSARFGLAEINLGVIPGAGAAVRLTRWLGRLRTKQILMLGEIVSGPLAVEWHLANQCVPGAELAKVTAQWATRLAAQAPLALGAAKRCVNTGSEAAMSVALEYELREFLALFNTLDQKEGMRAFLEKRKPHFVGR